MNEIQKDNLKDFLAWAIVVLVGGTILGFMFWATGFFFLVPFAVIAVIFVCAWALDRIFT